MGAIWRQVVARVSGVGLLVVLGVATGCSSSPGKESRANNGDACTAAEGCLSGHCSNGVCCSAGDCCSTPADCPASYREAASCTDAGATTTCQGTRRDATCTASACGTATVADDSACTGAVRDCGRYVSVLCSGDADQPVAACAARCSASTDCSAESACVDGACVARAKLGEACQGDAQGTCEQGLKCQNGLCCGADGATCCATASHCSGGLTCDATLHACNTTCEDYDASRCASASEYCRANVCVPKLADGETCSASGACASGFCQNAICCSGGACCRAPADCPDTFRQASTCTIRSAATDCQGTRRDATCTAFVCGSTQVADDSGCAGQVHGCGLYAAVQCTGAADQPAPACATSCTGSGDCSAGASCISVPPNMVCASSLPALVWDRGAWNNANWQ